MPQELRDYDTVVFDPAAAGRAGAGDTAGGEQGACGGRGILQRHDFARDAKILIDGGYKIDGVTPVDQFRHTPHVELVARFSR